MKYLVDANVLSEATRVQPDPAVVAWLEAHEPELVVGSIVLGELAVGVDALPRGRKKSRLEAWFDALVATVECLPWDAATARERARLVVELRRRGRAMPLFDSMIAATARTHGLTMVTPNIRDFEPANLDLVNPFDVSDPPGSVQERSSTYGRK